MKRIEYDYSKLRGRIVEKYGSQRAYAAAKGITATKLNRKLQNVIRFMPKDIEELRVDLDIDVDEIGAYFFTRKVQ